MAVSVLILAGQREGVVDPLCDAAGVSHKAMIPLLGRPMIDYVMEALDQADMVKPYFISGFKADYDPRLIGAPHGAGPADSALLALESEIALPALLTTCDHPLLSPEMIRAFIKGSKDSGADFCVGLARRSIIQPAYPHVKRTYLSFNDVAVSGCNLFYIANDKGLEAIRFWRQAQHFRKQPLKLAARVGLSIFWKYLTGRLSLDGAFEMASRQLSICAKPVLLPFAEAAIDVDKPSDKILVEDILRRSLS